MASDPCVSKFRWSDRELTFIISSQLNVSPMLLPCHSRHFTVFNILSLPPSPSLSLSSISTFLLRLQRDISVATVSLASCLASLSSSSFFPQNPPPHFFWVPVLVPLQPNSSSALAFTRSILCFVDFCFIFQHQVFASTPSLRG